MKKRLALILVLALLTAPAALAEAEILEPGVEVIDDWVFIESQENPADPSGDWYGDVNGFPMQLTLDADGAYTLASMAVPGETRTGTWEFADGYVWLDGDDTAPLNLTKEFVLSVDAPEAEPGKEEVLIWTTANVTFRREALAAYTPADPDETAAHEAFYGYWKSAYVSLGGVPIPASTLGDDTDVFIDDTRVALGGAMFGDVFVDFAFANDRLTASIGDDLDLTFVLLQDGLLRLTIEQPDGSMVLYFMPKAYDLSAD